MNDKRSGAYEIGSRRVYFGSGAAVGTQQQLRLSDAGCADAENR